MCKITESSQTLLSYYLQSKPIRFGTPLLTDVFWKEWTSIVLLCVLVTYRNLVITAQTWNLMCHGEHDLWVQILPSPLQISISLGLNILKFSYNTNLLICQPFLKKMLQFFRTSVIMNMFLNWIGEFVYISFRFLYLFVQNYR